MDNFDADVIVVGAGPTGLMLAGELALLGVSVIVLERLIAPQRESRALGFSARVIEEFAQRGLLSRFGRIETIPMGHFGGLPIDFRVLERGSYGARGIPQSRTEAILGEWAKGLGAEVHRWHEVTGLYAEDDGVEVHMTTPQGTKWLRTGYVVGCDGAHSTVREMAGIGFPGTEPTIEMLLADITGPSLRPRFTGERLPGGMIMVLPAAPGVSRVGLYERAAGLAHRDREPTFADVADAWERLTGEDIHDATPLWVSMFTDASRQADSYRKGRIFVAGDAAHVHLPQGGQGMSAGIGDAMNLAWKLAAEIHGYAPSALLDTYHTERHPVGARIIANTLAQATLYLSGDEMEPVRELFTELLAYESVQRQLIGMISGLDIRYDVGPGDHPLLGRRLPDCELTGVSGTSGTATAYQHLHAARPVVFDFADDRLTRAAASPWGDRVEIVTATPSTEAWMNLDGVDALLVRPDGYVAWVGRGSDPEGLTEALARWFGPADVSRPVRIPARASGQRAG